MTLRGGSHRCVTSKRVKEHLALPFVDLGKDQRTDLFLWVGKILYGLLYRQTAMAVDPADRQGATGRMLLPA